MVENETFFFCLLSFECSETPFIKIMGETNDSLAKHWKDQVQEGRETGGSSVTNGGDSSQEDAMGSWKRAPSSTSGYARVWRQRGGMIDRL